VVYDMYAPVLITEIINPDIKYKEEEVRQRKVCKPTLKYSVSGDILINEKSYGDYCNQGEE
jgi:hypothetical protein